MINILDKQRLYFITFLLDIGLISTLLNISIDLFDYFFIILILLLHITFYIALYYNLYLLLDYLHYSVFLSLSLSVFLTNKLLLLLSLFLFVVIQCLWILEDRCILLSPDSSITFGYSKELWLFSLLYTVILSFKIGYCY